MTLKFKTKQTIYTCNKKEWSEAKSKLSLKYKQSIGQISIILSFMKSTFKGLQFFQCFIDMNSNELNEKFLRSRMKLEDLWLSKLEKSSQGSKRVFLRYPNGDAIPIEKYTISKVIKFIEYTYARKTSLSEQSYMKIKKHLIKAYKDRIGSIDHMLNLIKTSKNGLSFLNMYKAYALHPVYSQNIWSVMLPEEKFVTYKVDYVDGTSKITYTYNATGKVSVKQYFTIDDVLNCINRYYQQMGSV
jgi:hypothetical protein